MNSKPQNKRNVRLILAASLMIFLCCLAFAPDVYAFLTAAVESLIFPAYSHTARGAITLLSCLRGLVFGGLLIGGMIYAGWWFYGQIKKFEQNNNSTAPKDE